MKNYIIIALLSIGLFAAASVQAQQANSPRAAKKEWKLHKKEGKIGRKMFRDRPNKAVKKKVKARKKAHKMYMKDGMYQ